MSRDKKEKFQDRNFLDTTLRPKEWEDYVGQEQIKKSLSILLQAAKERSHPPEHLLFHGPPGLGKTTLAHLVTKEIEANMRATSGPAIEKVGDLASVLTNLSDGDVLFIDEIHRLNKAVEEVLYPAMESGNLDIIIGKGPSARTIQLDLPPFTLVAATTRMALLSSPLRSRFSGGVHKLTFYNIDELVEILKRSAEILGVEASDDALREIAKRSRFTPRTANYFLKRARDFAQVHNKNIIDLQVVEETFKLLSVDQKGLSETDRNLLETIIDKFGGGPVGIKTIAASTYDEEETVEEVYEPYLIQIGFLERTSRGRVATKRAYKHLSKEFSNKAKGDNQDQLL